MINILRSMPKTGTLVYVVDGLKVSEWIITGNWPDRQYKLKKNDSDSFCFFDDSRFGYDFFISKNDADKELERRMNGKR